MRKVVVILGFIFSFLLIEQGWTANYSNPIDGVYKGTYGDAITVQVPSLVSKSPVSNENENGDLEFHLNASTAYANFSQLTDLKYGDPVRVQYNEDTTKAKELVAVSITRIDVTRVVGPVTTSNQVSVPAPAGQTVTTVTTTRVNSQ